MSTEQFNWLEGFLWCGFAVGTAWTARRSRRLRSPALLGSVAFLAFGISDWVEMRTGAWWRPWWLLVWKGVCVAVIVWVCVRMNSLSKHKQSN